ncbi:MAG TPA: response regulator transcription factor [Verrucomicrobiae bacterium]|jgi:DNA-binding NarL/FixJ family response regulator|nr:response regulator transcription factor [Verrucomicrobiae bacterium]
MITVSVVDDESSLRNSIAVFVNGSPGFRCVSTFPSGEAALEQLPNEWPDVILMDIHMAGISGIECVRRLKAIKPEVQIVMLTVYEDPEQIFAALKAGATGYMLKRLTPARLLEAIVEVHAGGSPMSHSIARKVLASFQKTPLPSAEPQRMTPREEMVLECLARGLTYQETANQLNISLDSVRTYVRRIYEKLHVHSRTEAVAIFTRR